MVDYCDNLLARARAQQALARATALQDYRNVFQPFVDYDYPRLGADGRPVTPPTLPTDFRTGHEDAARCAERLIALNSRVAGHRTSIMNLHGGITAQTININTRGTTFFDNYLAFLDVRDMVEWDFSRQRAAARPMDAGVTHMDAGRDVPSVAGLMDAGATRVHPTEPSSPTGADTGRIVGVVLAAVAVAIAGVAVFVTQRNAGREIGNLNDFINQLKRRLTDQEALTARLQTLLFGGTPERTALTASATNAMRSLPQFLPQPGPNSIRPTRAQSYEMIPEALRADFSKTFARNMRFFLEQVLSEPSDEVLGTTPQDRAGILTEARNLLNELTQAEAEVRLQPEETRALTHERVSTILNGTADSNHSHQGLLALARRLGIQEPAQELRPVRDEAVILEVDGLMHRVIHEYHTWRSALMNSGEATSAEPFLRAATNYYRAITRHPSYLGTGLTLQRLRSLEGNLSTLENAAPQAASGARFHPSVVNGIFTALAVDEWGRINPLAQVNYTSAAEVTTFANHVMHIFERMYKATGPINNIRAELVYAIREFNNKVRGISRYNPNYNRVELLEQVAELERLVNTINANPDDYTTSERFNEIVARVDQVASDIHYRLRDRWSLMDRLHGLEAQINGTRATLLRAPTTATTTPQGPTNTPEIRVVTEDTHVSISRIDVEETITLDVSDLSDTPAAPNVSETHEQLSLRINSWLDDFLENTQEGLSDHTTVRPAAGQRSSGAQDVRFTTERTALRQAVRSLTNKLDTGAPITEEDYTNITTACENYRNAIRNYSQFRNPAASRRSGSDHDDDSTPPTAGATAAAGAPVRRPCPYIPIRRSIGLPDRNSDPFHAADHPGLGSHAPRSPNHSWSDYFGPRGLPIPWGEIISTGAKNLFEEIFLGMARRI